MKWQPIETAPKDGTTILLDIGYPFAVIGAWNKPNRNWCYANIMSDLYHGKWNDTYFESESLSEDYVRKWMPLPDLEMEKK